MSYVVFLLSAIKAIKVGNMNSWWSVYRSQVHVRLFPFP